MIKRFRNWVDFFDHLSQGRGILQVSYEPALRLPVDTTTRNPLLLSRQCIKLVYFTHIGTHTHFVANMVNYGHDPIRDKGIIFEDRGHFVSVLQYDTWGDLSRIVATPTSDDSDSPIETWTRRYRVSIDPLIIEIVNEGADE